MKMINKSKCEGVDRGKQLIQPNSEAHNKIMEIVNKNKKLVEETINGPYRFGCI